MTTGTLALIIVVAIIAQVALGGVIAMRRRHKARREVAVAGVAGSDTAGTLPPAADDAAWKGFRSFRVARRVQENEAGDVVSFYLEPEKPQTLPPFKPGQFLTLQCEPAAAGGAGRRKAVRCYSLSDRPREDAYRITVKREPDGLVSNHLHDHVQEGDCLMVKAPSGHFHLLESSPLPLVLIAGGIGITPMLSILMSLLARDSEREIWLYYGVRNGREAVMHARLQELARRHPQFHLHLCYSRPDPADRPGVDYRHAGRVDISLLQQTLKLGRYEFYVCGPSPMMESMVPGLEALGIDPGNIHYEAFGPASVHRPNQPSKAAPAPSGGNWRVNFGRSGKTAEWNDGFDSLLNFAEAEGIAVDSACRAGSCGSCQTRIEKGEVIYDREPDAEVEVGHCLLCVSRPRSDLTLAL